MKHTRKLIVALIMLCFAVAPFFARNEAVPASDTEDYGIKLPVLMYHQVLDEKQKLGKYVVSPREFEEDLRYISELGYETVTVSELVDFCNGKRKLPRKPIMLTFDDGYQTDYLNVFPLLKKYNMKAVFSVVGCFAERYSTPGIDKHINYAHLSWNEIREMQASGLCEFQNHSYNMHSLENRHGCLPINGESTEHYRALMHEDIELSQKLFEEKTGQRPICFTYPYGGRNETLLEIIKEEGFLATLGTYEQINVLTGELSELYDIRRYNRAHGRDITKILENG